MPDQRHPTAAVYVLGTAHGATSILGRVLGLMEGATYAGELRRLWSRGLPPGRLCGCGRPHNECPIWSQLLTPDAIYLQPNLRVLGRLQERAAPATHSWWHALQSLRLRRLPPDSTATGRYMTILRETYKAFASAAGARVVIDTSKNPVDAALLALESGISTYCVEIVRDPRGVVFSQRRRTTRDDVRRSRPLQTVGATVFWIVSHLTSAVVRRKYGPKRSLLLRYEDFVERPGEAIAAASALVGVAPPDVALAPSVRISLPDAHGPDGHGRFRATDLVLNIDDAWETQLHPLDRFLVTVLASPFLRRYGYIVGSARRPLRTP